MVAIKSSPTPAFTDLKALHGIEVRVYIVFVRPIDIIGNQKSLSRWRLQMRFLKTFQSPSVGQNMAEGSVEEIVPGNPFRNLVPKAIWPVIGSI